PNVVPVHWGRDEGGYGVVCMPFLGGATLLDVLDRVYPEGDSPPPRGAEVLLAAIRAAARPGDPAPALDTSEPAAYLRKGAWPEAGAAVGERLAAALAAVHGAGVCHRDLKPSNVLIDAAGRPRLIDFNLSQDERLGGSRVGGTLPYMSPEQLRYFTPGADGGPAPDARADLYALGVVLYELLAGQHPFGPVSL